MPMAMSASPPQQPQPFPDRPLARPGAGGPEDIIQLDLDGQPIRDEDRSLYLERFIHAAILTA